MQKLHVTRGDRMDCNKTVAITVSPFPHDRENESIYLHHSGPLLEDRLDRPENRYGRYGFASFPSISVSTAGVARARVSV